ncbi:triphosphoribosyl-dephospho-CoA synthase MdcB [Noviherbaspirillum sp. UKPF54]|uniref:triphosphoribosyl-dephospho-CoA synthase MdcB n=1 Tax=Noviherbaspirillum sp. UKPF54 TaxID=2601898 RepID=UPI001FED9274|nr:triphosphoribosyl-dephospho-CoA synthase MdcB [Noviherbaspirillum sp. UKPF54]
MHPLAPMLAGLAETRPAAPGKTFSIALARQQRRTCLAVGRMAVQSLYDELMLYPKPGLVSAVDNGSHDDMNAGTFMRSMFSLRHYFIAITQAGMNDAPFSELKRLGIKAEQSMLRTTGGINTHRGAIFALGMLCAAVGHCHSRRVTLSARAIRAALLSQWGEALQAHTRAESNGSHGQLVAAMHAASGAREEAAQGFPAVFDIALPALWRTLDGSLCWERARIDALFALMAHISDTNVYYRRGAAGAGLVREHARRFIARGGTCCADWRAHAQDCHRIFTGQRLSPGGAADLLAAACFIHKATGRLPRSR